MGPNKLANPRIAYDKCPLCSSHEIRKVFHASCTAHPAYNEALPDTITSAVCESCDHVFTDGYFSDEALKVVFGTTLENQKLGYDLENQRLVSARMLDRVVPFRDKGTWLDVGFGNGALLLTAAEYGFVPVGIDLREDNVKALRGLGIEAHRSDLSTLDHEGRYDVVSMADVLEHMPFPRQALQRVQRLLKCDGILFLSMPNTDGALWIALDNNQINPYWGELEHYHNFGRRRLYALLEECGFSPLRYGVSERYRACMEVIARKRADESGPARRID